MRIIDTTGPYTLAFGEENEVNFFLVILRSPLSCQTVSKMPNGRYHCSHYPFDELVDLVLKTLITLIASLILILNFLFRDRPNDFDDI